MIQAVAVAAGSSARTPKFLSKLWISRASSESTTPAQSTGEPKPLDVSSFFKSPSMDSHATCQDIEVRAVVSNIAKMQKETQSRALDPL